MKISPLLSVFWLLILIFAVLLVTDAFPSLRGDAPWIPPDGRWRWPIASPPDVARLIAPGLGVALYTIGAWRLLRARRTTPLILWAYGGAVLIPLLLMTIDTAPLFLLFTRSASTITGGYQYAAATIPDLGQALRDWPGFVDRYLAETHLNPPSGVALSPPGLVALVEGSSALFAAIPPAARQFSDIVRPLQCQNLTMMTWRDADLASAWMQMFMPLWAALGVAPLHRLGVMLFDRQRARLAVALWPLVPGLALFQPRFNVFFPLVTLVMLQTLWRSLLQDRPRWIGLSGLVLSVGLLMNLSLIPLGLLAGLIILGTRLCLDRAPARSLTSDRAAWRLIGRDLVVFGVGVASIWLLYGALVGRLPLDVLRDSLSRHIDLYRPYLPWLIMHPYDMFLFVGWPVALLALWRMIHLVRRRARGEPFTRPDILAGTTALTLVILILSGTARGETGRVWLFFAPVWLLLAADMLADPRLAKALSPRAAQHILAMQAIVLFSMAAVLRPNFTALTEPVEVRAAATAPMYPVDAQFSRGTDSLTYVGLDVQAQPDTVELSFHWRADTRIRDAYVLTLVSIPPDGSTRPSLEWNPRQWDYPPSCWTPGQTFVDTVTVPLGEPPVPGDWVFSLSILDAFTHEPMQVTLPDGRVSAQVGIGPVPVPAP